MASARKKPAAKKIAPATKSTVSKTSSAGKKAAASKQAAPRAGKPKAATPKGTVRTATSLPMPATVTVNGKLYAVGEYGGLMEIDEQELLGSRQPES
jgi:hypothetical protein